MKFPTTIIACLIAFAGSTNAAPECSSFSFRKTGRDDGFHWNIIVQNGHEGRIVSGLETPWEKASPTPEPETHTIEQAFTGIKISAQRTAEGLNVICVEESTIRGWETIHGRRIPNTVTIRSQTKTEHDTGQIVLASPVSVVPKRFLFLRWNQRHQAPSRVITFQRTDAAF